MATCIKCNQSIPDGSLFCNHCGAKQELTCPSCGAVLPENSKFCNLCGAKVAEDAPKVDVPKEEPAPVVEPVKEEQPKIIKSVKNVSGLYTNGYLKSISARAAVFAADHMLWRVDENMQYRAWDAGYIEKGDFREHTKNADILAVTQTEDDILVAVAYKDGLARIKEVHLIRLSDTFTLLDDYILETPISTCRLTAQYCYQIAAQKDTLSIIRTHADTKASSRWDIKYLGERLGEVWAHEEKVYYTDLNGLRCFDTSSETNEYILHSVDSYTKFLTFDSGYTWNNHCFMCSYERSQNQPFERTHIRVVHDYNLNRHSSIHLPFGYFPNHCQGYFDGLVSFCHPMFTDLFMIDKHGNVSKNWRTGPAWCGDASLAIFWKNYLIADLTTEDWRTTGYTKIPNFVAYPKQFEKPTQGCISLKRIDYDQSPIKLQ